MVSCFDYTVSSLLCTEDDSIFCDDLDDVFAYDVDVELEHQTHRINNETNQALAFDAIPLQSEECLTKMVDKECEQLPSSDYLMRFKNGDLDSDARMEAIDWIAKVHYHFNFGPLCAYLAINYLDRFLSTYELPSEEWVMQLTALGCLSLAAKLDETYVPLLQELQVDESHCKFESKTIQRMEFVVLDTLKWRMKPITPFSYLDYFLDKIKSDESIPRSSIDKSTELILSTLREIEFLEFKPSEIAAAVAITQAEDNEIAINALTKYVGKERVMKCVEMMKDLKEFAPVQSLSMAFAPQSPIGVLDAARSCYKIEDSIVESSHNSPVAKRRKLNIPSEAQL